LSKEKKGADRSNLIKRNLRGSGERETRTEVVKFEERV